MIKNKKVGNQKMSILKKLVIITFVILACNALIGFAVYNSNQKQLETQAWVKLSEDVIAQSNILLSIGLESESSARGYVITQDSSFLSQIVSSNSYFQNIEKLRELTRGNESQQKRLDSISYYMSEYLAFSYKAIELRNTQGLDPAVQLISTNKGKNLTEKIRQLISYLKKEEANLLSMRKESNKFSSHLFNSLTIGMFGLMGLFTILLLVATTKSLIQSKREEKNTAELKIVINERDYQSEEKVKLEAANKELEAFSYSISHDLRAPLRHIVGFVDLLKRSNADQLNASGLRYLNIIAESAVEMGKLIDAILSFSRLSRGELNLSRINSNDMVKKVIKSFGTETADRNIEFNQLDLSEIMGDENLINQVWVNLISNAIKYTSKKEKAIVEIGCKPENSMIVFYIKDNGVGFDMTYATKLFGVFQRLHKATDFEGIGIGLANINRIILRHNGKCWAESEVNNGATFYFSVPNIL